jgi:hypothetical protein
MQALESALRGSFPHLLLAALPLYPRKTYSVSFLFPEPETKDRVERANLFNAILTVPWTALRVNSFEGKVKTATALPLTKSYTKTFNVLGRRFHVAYLLYLNFFHYSPGYLVADQLMGLEFQFRNLMEEGFFVSTHRNSLTLSPNPPFLEKQLPFLH